MENTTTEEFRERLLWEEVRSLRDILMRLCQWGITALLGVQTAIFFIRKDTYEILVASDQIHNGDPLPLDRYLIGTAFLLVVAAIFSTMTIIIGNRYRFYKNILIDENRPSRILIKETSRFGRWVVVALYSIFPLMDIALRLYISIDFHIR